MYHRPPPGLHRRPIFEPQCTHATMTRVYSPNLLCAHCHYPGPSGWLYQCTQDREDLIEHAVARGEFVWQLRRRRILAFELVPDTQDGMLTVTELDQHGPGRLPAGAVDGHSERERRCS